MSKFKFYQQLKAEEQELLETLSALQLLIKRYEVENQEVVKTEVSSSQAASTVSSGAEKNNLVFEDNMSISKKILFVLETLKKATSREVAEKAYQLDKSRSSEQWIDDSRFYLSKFYNEKKLIVYPPSSGQRGNVYAFPPNS